MHSAGAPEQTGRPESRRRQEDGWEGGCSAQENKVPALRPHALLTDREAPTVIGVARKTLQEWRRLGKGPPFIRVSNRCFYRYSELLEFLASCPRTVSRRSSK